MDYIKKQNIFHMYPQSLMKYFFLNETNNNGFIIYDFKNKTFSNHQISKKTINSINLDDDSISENIRIFEEELSLCENEYANFLAEIIDCTNNVDKIKNELDNEKKSNKIKEIEFEKFEEKWKNYKSKTSLNLAQFFYYLTIQLKYFNAFFIDGIIQEKKFENLLTFLKLNNENVILNNDEKQWFYLIKKLKDFDYSGSLIMNNKKYIKNFSFNTRFHCAFTSNPISIAKIDKNMICFSLPIDFAKSITIFFISKNTKEKKKNELIYKECKRSDLLMSQDIINNRLMPWKYANYNFWNNEKNVLIPNKDILDTRLIYYPFDVFSYGFGLEKKILNKNKIIIENELEINLSLFNEKIKRKNPAYQYSIYLQNIFNYKKNNSFDKIKKLDIINKKIFNENKKEMNNNFNKAIETQWKGSLLIFYYMILKYEKSLEYNQEGFGKEYKEEVLSLITKWNKQYYNYESILL